MACYLLCVNADLLPGDESETSITKIWLKYHNFIQGNIFKNVVNKMSRFVQSQHIEGRA